MTFKVGFKIKAQKKNTIEGKITLKFQLSEVVMYLSEVFTWICLGKKLF